jgi:hypothetical protein
VVHKWRNTRRRSIDYSPNAPPCNLCCDVLLTGGSGVLSQGSDYLSADVIAFWSGKFNSAQQNYPVHELELLAIVHDMVCALTSRPEVPCIYRSQGPGMDYNSEEIISMPGALVRSTCRF